MYEIRDLWSGDVDITEMGDADFEKRSAYISVRDKDGTYAQLADSLAEHWGTDRPSAIDRATRLFLAKCVWDGTFVFNRDEYEIGVLLPPKYWIADNVDAPITDVTAERGEGERTSCLSDVETRQKWEMQDFPRTVVASIPPTVDELIDEMVSETDYEQRTDIAWDSLRWLVALD